MKYSQLIENNNELVQKFLNHIKNTEHTFHKMYCIRGNCGPAALHMKSWAEKEGIILKRIRGYFITDEVVYDKADFTPEMKKELINSGLTFNKASDRKQFIKNNDKYNEEWKKIPHYWLVDDYGNIYDPTGYDQFIKTNLSHDLNKSRYQQSEQ